MSLADGEAGESSSRGTASRLCVMLADHDDEAAGLDTSLFRPAARLDARNQHTLSELSSSTNDSALPASIFDE